MEIEIETEAMAVAAMIGRDSTTVMGMMILANEGISLSTTSGLLGGSPPFQHFSIRIFFSPFVGVRHAISVSHFFDSSMGKPVFMQRLRQPSVLSVPVLTTRRLCQLWNKSEGPRYLSGAPPQFSTQRCYVVGPQQGRWSITCALILVFPSW